MKQMRSNEVKSVFVGVIIILNREFMLGKGERKDIRMMKDRVLLSIMMK